MIITMRMQGHSLWEEGGVHGGVGHPGMVPERGVSSFWTSTMYHVSFILQPVWLMLLAWLLHMSLTLTHPMMSP